MAGNKDTGKAALSSWPLAISKTKTHRKSKTPRKSRRADPIKRRRRGGQFLRFPEARGKTVDFVEMYSGAEFPCVEVAFTDKTALLVAMDTRLIMEPVYSDWKTGDQRLLRRWPAREAT